MHTIERKIFLDETLNREFHVNGFRIVKNAVNADLLDSLLQFYKTHNPAAAGGFHTTMFYSNAALRQKVHEHIAAQLQPVIHNYLYNYRAFLGNYIVKEPRETTSLGMHQDWSFVDETRYESVNLWCPLVNVDEHNGALRMLKGSNRLTNLQRSASVPFPFTGQYAAWEKDLTPCPLQKGDIILFNSRIVHSSFLNQTDNTRVAITLTSIPSEAQAYHYHQAGAEIVKYKIEESFYYTYQIGQPPSKEWQPEDISAR